MTRYRRVNWKETLERNHVKLYVPGQERLVEIADERTRGMVTVFSETVNSMRWMEAWEAVGVLARSAYMQGIRDAADALARNKEQP